MKAYFVASGSKAFLVLSLVLLLIALPANATRSCDWSSSECADQFPTKDTSKSFLEQRYYFEGCDFGNTSVLYCPHPLLEKLYSCSQSCVECCSDPWECSKWETTGCEGTGSVEVLSEPCGISYDGSNWTLGSWSPRDTTDWVCPNARKLAELYDPQPSTLSFGGLSIGGQSSNNILRSGEETQLSFTAFVEACLNRIPMLRLKAEIINSTGNVESTEYGLYTKHQTINYSADSSEDTGTLGGFMIPNQSVFRKSYRVDGTLDGFVAWAWRQQFVEATEKMVDLSGESPGTWKVLPGGVPVTPSRVGDIYYSKDFISGFAALGAPVQDCITNISSTRVCAIKTLTVGKLESTPICDSNDLESYYNTKGITTSFEKLMRESCSISNEVDLTGALNLVHSPDVTAINNKNYVFTLNVATEFGMNYTQFKAFYIDNASNIPAFYQKINTSGYLNKTNFKSIIDNYMMATYGSTGCAGYNYNYALASYALFSTTQLSNSTAEVTLLVNLSFTEDFITQLNIGTSFEYDCSEDWSWGNFSDLDPNSLAECLYNWDLCLKSSRDGGTYMEVVSAGYGPMEATPTLEKDTARILLDGGIMQETQSRNIVAYKSCPEYDAWVVPPQENGTALLYACPIEAWLSTGGFSSEFVSDKLKYVGKLPVLPSYPKDYSEGDQFMILKCSAGVSNDELGFVQQVPLGSFASMGRNEDGKKVLYICTGEGWKLWRPSGLIECVNESDPNCPEVCTDPTDPACNININYTDVDMFEVVPKMVNVGLGQGGFNIWYVSILNKENRTVDAELFALSKINDFPAAINWIEFSNTSEGCDEGCKKVNVSLGGTGEGEPYSGMYTEVHLNKAERLGLYEYDFVVREKSTGRELYRDTVWLNVISDSVGSESILGIVLVFTAGIALVIWRTNRKK